MYPAQSPHATQLKLIADISAQLAPLADDLHNPSFFCLNEIVDDRVFAADDYNHTIKFLNLRTPSVHNLYNSDRWVVAVCARCHLRENPSEHIAALEVQRSGIHWEWRRVCFFRQQNNSFLEIASETDISERTQKRFVP